MVFAFQAEFPECSPSGTVWQAEIKKTLAGCLALLGEDARPSNGPVDIVIEGKVIREIRPSGARKPGGAVIDLSGRLVTAGLINAHHHSHEGFYKGRKDNLPLELWIVPGV